MATTIINLSEARAKRTSAAQKIGRPTTVRVRDMAAAVAADAYRRLPGKSERLAIPLGVSDGLVRQWRRGLPSPLVRVLLQVWALEADGVDTSSFDEALEAVRGAARQPSAAAEVIPLFPAEERANYRVNLAQLRAAELPEDPGALQALDAALTEQILASREIRAAIHSRLTRRAS